MKNNFIIIFSDKYIKNDINILMLFLSNISQGKTLPYFINFQLIRYIFYKILYFLFYFIYFIKLNKILIKNIYLENNFLIKINGS